MSNGGWREGCSLQEAAKGAIAGKKVRHAGREAHLDGLRGGLCWNVGNG